MRQVIFLLTLLLVCCHDNCTPESTKCSGDTIQICNSEKDWYDVEDCTTIQPGLWECCENAFEYEGENLTTCVPIDTCENDGGIE